MELFRIPAPRLQIDFSFALGQMRALYLQEALAATVKEVDFSLLNEELAEYVPEPFLKSLAALGLRGELVFPVPCLLNRNPRMLGYYRLLLGFSQKAFYTPEFGVSGFKSMEESGRLTEHHKSALPDLCRALIDSACTLVEGIGLDRISRELLDDLALLTIGPQLRGGANNRKGQEGIVQVFEIIHDIVRHAARSSNSERAPDSERMRAGPSLARSPSPSARSLPSAPRPSPSARPDPTRGSGRGFSDDSTPGRDALQVSSVGNPPGPSGFRGLLDSLAFASLPVSQRSKIELENAAGRRVVIAFASDPDIVIREEMARLDYRNVIAIEIKGGTDFSNIHNRIGEAEKSHQKAKASGHVECWTVVNVDRIDLDMAKRESPSTHRFYRLSALAEGTSEECRDFENRIISLTGIRSRK